MPLLLSVRTPCGILDIAVLRRDRSGIVAIVECKRNGRVVYANSRQIHRYKAIGVPIYGLNDLSHAKKLALTIFHHHRNDAGKTWAEVSATIPLQRRFR